MSILFVCKQQMLWRVCICIDSLEPMLPADATSMEISCTDPYASVFPINGPTYEIIVLDWEIFARILFSQIALKGILVM